MNANDHLISTVEQLEALYGEKNPNSIVKEIDHINGSYRKLIEAAPFVAVATVDRKASTVRRKAMRAASCASSTTRPRHSRSAGQQPPRRFPQHIARPAHRSAVSHSRHRRNPARQRPRLNHDRARADAELRCQRQAAALRSDRARRDRLFPLLEGDRALEALGRSDKSIARACRQPELSSPS